MFRRVWTVSTRGRETQELTAKLQALVAESGVRDGLCHVFIHHTSASLMLCENADPDVRRDLETFMGELVPDGDPRFVHDAEGPDDMPAHIKAAMMPVSLSIPIFDGQLALGTWQGLYLFEHRTAPHSRQVAACVIASP